MRPAPIGAAPIGSGARPSYTYAYNANGLLTSETDPGRVTTHAEAPPCGPASGSRVFSSLAGRPTAPDNRAVIRAVTRRDQARAVIDGMTAANELGFTTAVPARIEVLVDARLKPIRLGAQEIHFKFAAPSRLYWADRPAMRVVQALHWMQDMLGEDKDRRRVQATLRRILNDPNHGRAIRDDLRAGFSALPIWMQEFLRELLSLAKADEARA